jgi:hypothetical protein
MDVYMDICRCTFAPKNTEQESGMGDPDRFCLQPAAARASAERAGEEEENNRQREHQREVSER